MTADVLDLGDGHTLRWHRWAPDRELNPQYADIPDVPRFSASVEHTSPVGQRCVGGVTLDLPEVRRVLAMDSARTRQPAMWTVESWEPLTLSPSLLCSCGDHGWVREGRWVRA